MTPQIRRFSKLLYGSSYRLEVVAAIHRKQRCYAREIAIELGINDNLVTLELGHLEAAGLLKKEGRPLARKPQFYRRVPHEFWGSAARVLRAFANE